MRACELEAPTSPVNKDASSEVGNGDTAQPKKSMFRGLRSPSSSNNVNHPVTHPVYTKSSLSRVFGEDPKSVSRWLKEKAEKKKRHTAALQQKAKKIYFFYKKYVLLQPIHIGKAKKVLRKRPKTPQELARLKHLQSLIEEAGSDEDVTTSGTRSLFSSAQSVTTHTSSMTLSNCVLRCVNLSVLHPIFLYVSLLFLLFGLPSLSRCADSSLRVVSLLIGYGIVAGLTLWTSFVVSFDSAELSASSTHSLKKAKKLFVVYSGISIVTLIGAIIGFSLLRGAIIILGSLYLTDELNTSSSSELNWKLVCIQTCSDLLVYVTTPMIFFSISLWYAFSFSIGKKKSIAAVTSSRISTKVKKEGKDKDISDSISVF